MLFYPGFVAMHRVQRQHQFPVFPLGGASPPVSWKRTGRTVRFHGVDEHIFAIVEVEENTWDWRVEVPAFRVPEEPDLQWVQDDAQFARDGACGMDVYLVPFNRWYARIDAKGIRR
jgi:hypothetical protein